MSTTQITTKENQVSTPSIADSSTYSNFEYTFIPVIPETKLPAMRAGFHYDGSSFKYGQDYRNGNLRQAGHVTDVGSRLICIDVDDPEKFDQSKLSSLVDLSEATYVSANPNTPGKCHIYVDARNISDEAWPVQGDGIPKVYDIKSAGFVRAEPAYLPTGRAPLEYDEDEWRKILEAIVEDRAANPRKGKSGGTGGSAGEWENPEYYYRDGTKWTSGSADVASMVAQNVDDEDILELMGAILQRSENYTGNGEEIQTWIDSARAKGFDKSAKNNDALMELRNAPVRPLGATESEPEGIWGKSPVLMAIRQAAYSRRVSADAVLGAMLALVSAQRPRALNAYTHRGPLSLNMYTGLIGAASSGKTEAASCAEDLLLTPDHLQFSGDNQTPYKSMGLSSGEGILDLFRGEKTLRTPNIVDGKDVGGRGVKVKEQMRWNGLLTADEGQTLDAVATRSGSTTAPILRSAWSGKPLSTANVLDNQREIEGYSLGFIACFQPALLENLLSGADLGTPQRFFFASTIDPSIPEERPEFPSQIKINYPAPPRTQDGRPQWHITYEASITARVDAKNLAVVRGLASPDPLNGRHDEMCYRVSALLSLLLGRRDAVVDEEVWELAEGLVTRSEAVRDGYASWQREKEIVRVEVAEEHEQDREDAKAGIAITQMKTYLLANPSATDGAMWNQAVSSKYRKPLKDRRAELILEARS